MFFFFVDIFHGLLQNISPWNANLKEMRKENVLIFYAILYIRERYKHIYGRHSTVLGFQ